MTLIPLGSPTEITRTGATDQWTGLGDGLPATCSPISPGDKTWLVKFQIDPTDPLPVLPEELTLEVDASYTPFSTGCWVVDDVVQFGDSTGPSGTNFADDERELAATRLYTLSTAGISLEDLNAGDVYLYLGWKAIPEAAFDSGDWDIDISPASPVTVTGALVLDVTTEFIVTATWTGVGDPPPYVPLELTGSAKAGGEAVPPNATEYGGSVTVDNGLGASDGGAVEAPTIEFPDAITASSVLLVTTEVVDGVGTYPVTMHSTTNITGANQQGYVVHTLSATVEAPDDSALTLASVALSYTFPATDNDFNGPFGLGDDHMGFAKIDDVRTISAQFTRPSTQEEYDATGSPAYRVYEGTATTPILTGSLALQDDGNTVGFYSADIVISAANGFEVDKTYTVRVSATVDGIAQGGIVDRFQVRDIAADLWGAAREELEAATPRAATRGEALDQMYAEKMNFKSSDGDTVRVYEEGATSVNDTIVMQRGTGRSTNAGGLQTIVFEEMDEPS